MCIWFFISGIGFFESDEGTILKSLQPPPDKRGPREVAFYQKVFDPECKDPILLELQQILPKYTAVREMNVSGQDKPGEKLIFISCISGWCYRFDIMSVLPLSWLNGYTHVCTNKLRHVQ